MGMGKNNAVENIYFMTTSNVTNTIDTHEKQKYLGLVFDSKYTFEEHVIQDVNKATKITIQFIRAIQFLGKHTSLLLCKTMVRVHLD